MFFEGVCARILGNMPNLSASKKSLRADKRKTVFNLRVKRTMKAVLKETRELAVAGKIDEAKAKMSSAYKAVDKAAKRNIIAKNAASRTKSRLSKFIKNMKEKTAK